MAKRLHIFNRNGVFYWRRRLPDRVARAFGRSHLLLSLRVRDRKAAGRLASILSANFDQFLHIMQIEQRDPTQVEIQAFLHQLYKRILEGCRDEQMRYYTDAEVRQNPGAPHEEGDIWDPDDFDECGFFQDPQETANRFRKDRVANEFVGIRWLLGPILAKANIDAETNTLPFRRFLNLALQFAIKAFEDGHAEVSGMKSSPVLDHVLATARSQDGIFESAEPLSVDFPPTATPATPLTPVSQRSATPPLSTYFEPFVKQAIDEGVWKKGTEKHNRNSLNLMIRIIGDKPAGTVGRADASSLRRTLERLPSNLGKSSRHNDMKIEDIVAQMKAEELTMSEATLDRHWRAMVAFFKWLNRQDDVPATDIDRVFGGFRWGKHVPSEEDRNTWDSDSLKTLFSSPIWTGFAPHPGKRYWRHQPGQVVVKDEYWWLPLLGAYHGARLEELCRLTGRDVCELDGFLCLRFRGAHLKNDGSERDIPIHSAVLRLGFLEFAAKAGHGRLFPAMIPGGPDNKYGYEYSQDFSEYRKKINVYKKLMDFHSFRHQVTTKILNGGGTILIADDITGHDSEQRKELKETQSTTMVYFDGYGKKILKDAIETVQYPEIDIDRLILLALDSEKHDANLAKRYPRVWGRAPEKRKRA